MEDGTADGTVKCGMACRKAGNDGEPGRKRPRIRLSRVERKVDTFGAVHYGRLDPPVGALWVGGRADRPPPSDRLTSQPDPMTLTLRKRHPQ